LLLVAGRELPADLRAKGGASDLVQQTFLEAQRDFARFQGHSEGELLAWLRQVLLHKLAHFVSRYYAEKRRVALEVPLTADDSLPASPREPSADTPSPSGRAMAREQQEALARALERLPEDYRRVIRLRYEEERSFGEIAGLMGRSENAVRKLWARA